MSDYEKTLWLGRAWENYWNWEITGIGDNDFKARAEACDEFIEELKVIKGYYDSLDKQKGKASK